MTFLSFEEFHHFLMLFMIDLHFYIKSQSIGAVNCVIRRPSDGKLVGYNTDYVGAISAIEDGLRGCLKCFRSWTEFSLDKFCNKKTCSSLLQIHIKLAI